MQLPALWQESNLQRHAQNPFRNYIYFCSGGGGGVAPPAPYYKSALELNGTFQQFMGYST